METGTDVTDQNIIEEQQTETLDILYLEWSQFTKARTARELKLQKQLEAQLVIGGSCNLHDKRIKQLEAQLDESKDSVPVMAFNDLIDRNIKLQAQLEATQLRLKTCSTNCTTHELNEAKALAQLAAVRNCKYVIVNGMEFCLRDDIKAAIGEGET